MWRIAVQRDANILAPTLERRQHEVIFMGFGQPYHV
jgi:hypothetical protein